MNSLLATKYLEGGGVPRFKVHEKQIYAEYSARDSILGPLDGQVDSSIKP